MRISWAASARGRMRVYALRKIGRPGVQVIAMSDGSGTIGWQALNAALSLGAAGAVEKPLQHNPLLRVIEEALAA